MWSGRYYEGSATVNEPCGEVPASVGWLVLSHKMVPSLTKLYPPYNSMLVWVNQHYRWCVFLLFAFETPGSHSKQPTLVHLYRYFETSRHMCTHSFQHNDDLHFLFALATNSFGNGNRLSVGKLYIYLSFILGRLHSWERIRFLCGFAHYFIVRLSDNFHWAQLLVLDTWLT